MQGRIEFEHNHQGLITYPLLMGEVLKMYYLVCVLLVSLSIIGKGDQTRESFERDAIKYHKLKDYNAAKKTCVTAYEYFKNKQPPDLAAAAYFAYLAGTVNYHQFDDYDEAEKYLSIFIQAFTSDAISVNDITSAPWYVYGYAQLTRARIFIKKKKYDLAQSLLKLSIEHGDEETKSKACLLLGDIYENGGYGVAKDKAESLYWLQKAADYGNYDAMYNLGMKYYQEKNYPFAYKFFKDASLNLASDNVPVLTMLALMYANGQYVEKNLSKAESYYRTALNNRFGPGTANNLALLLAEEEKNLSEAEDLMKKAIKIKPDCSVFFNTYGLILFKKKNYQEALKMYLKANEISGNKDEDIQKQIKIIQKILNPEKKQAHDE